MKRSGNKIRWSVVWLVVGLGLSFGEVKAQDRQVTSKQQIWLGYMTSTYINPKYSLWNDFHFVPGGFFVARTGLTRTTKYVNLTAGYGFLLLPISTSTSTLKRSEHRPWSQVLITIPLSDRIRFIQRTRYDARFRQDIVNGERTNTYSFTNRFRFSAGFRINGPLWKETLIPFMSISDEILLNAWSGKSVQTFDQNRIQISVGIQSGKIQYQIGYMNRFVQTGPNRFTENHMVLFWVTHSIRFSKANQQLEGE